MQQPADPRTTVRITHHYAASPARVFDAWLAPQLAGLWLFATASRPMIKVNIDARAGGAFRLVERRAGTVIEHRGRYDEILRPQRLVFRLHSKDCAPHATRVTAVFTPQGSTCMLELMHDGLPADQAAHIEARWEGMFYGLGSVLAQASTAEKYNLLF